MRIISRAILSYVHRFFRPIQLAIAKSLFFKGCRVFRYHLQWDRQSIELPILRHLTLRSPRHRHHTRKCPHCDVSIE